MTGLILVIVDETVHVIQSDPVLLQPVVYGRCLASRSPILQADCRQVTTLNSVSSFIEPILPTRFLTESDRPEADECFTGLNFMLISISKRQHIIE